MSINTALQANGGVILAPVVLAAMVIAWLRMRRRRAGEGASPGTTGAAGRPTYLKYYLFPSVVLVGGLLPWVAVGLALGFDWDRDDVAALRVSVYDSPDTDRRPDRTVEVTDGPAVRRAFDAVARISGGSGVGRGHPVGTTYVVGLRRRSDNAWSRYRVVVHPESEATNGGVRMRTYETSLEHTGWLRFDLGSYQASDLGQFLAETIRADETRTQERK